MSINQKYPMFIKNLFLATNLKILNTFTYIVIQEVQFCKSYNYNYYKYYKYYKLQLQVLQVLQFSKSLVLNIYFFSSNFPVQQVQHSWGEYINILFSKKQTHIFQRKNLKMEGQTNCVLCDFRSRSTNSLKQHMENKHNVCNMTIVQVLTQQVERVDDLQIK